MKNSLATRESTVDKQQDRDIEAFEKLLNERMDKRQREHDLLSGDDQNRIFEWTVELRRSEPDSEEHRDLVHKLKRKGHYLAVAGNWKDFVEFVNSDVSDGDDDDRAENPEESDEVDDEESADPTVEAEETPEIPANTPKPQTAGRAAADGITRRTVEPVSTGARTSSIPAMTASQGDGAAKTSSSPDSEEDPRPPSTSKGKLPAKKKRSVNGTSSAGPEDRTPEYWAQKIAQQTERTVGAFMELGRVLIQAKAALPHGGWVALFERGLTSLSLREAEKLMRIAAHPGLSNSTNWSNLPGAQQALLTLSRLSPVDLEIAIEEQKIKPTTTIREAEEVVAKVMGNQDRKTAPAEPPVFNVAKAVDQCLKPINKAIEAAGEDHKETFLEKMADAVAEMRAVAVEA